MQPVKGAIERGAGVKMFTLVVTEKGGTRQLMKFDEEVISVGRVQGNEIVLPRGNVSKRHAKLELKRNRFLLTDLGSTNGTYVNGRRIHEPTDIFHTDKIYIGDYIINLQERDGLEPEDEPPADEPLADEPREQAEAAPKTPPKKEQAPPPPGAPRPRAPAPPRPRITKITSDSPDDSTSENKKSAPKNLPRPTTSSAVREDDTETPSEPASAPSESGDEASTSELFTLVETVIDHVARQIKRVDRTRAPLVLDAGTAGQVRLAIGEVVDDLAERGKLPPSVPADILRGKAFRAIVDLGSLSRWLDDPTVRIIRITSPGVASLLKSEQWIDESGSYLTQEDISEMIRCLSAGLESRDSEAGGVSWYRLEEGYLVFTSAASGAAFGPAIVVDKTAGPDMEDSESTAIPNDALSTLKDAIEARAKIAVVGGSGPARLTVLEAVVGILPPDEFVVTVEDIPFASVGGSNKLRLNAGKRDAYGSKGGDVTGAISHALKLEPAWIVVGGTEVRDVPSLLSIAAGRLGIIADLSLGGAGRLDKELATAMVAAGSPVAGEEATVLMEEAFDLVIVVGRSGDGQPVVQRILACAISEGGGWAPRTLFDITK